MGSLGTTDTTWDGKPIASEPPIGALILVYRVKAARPECLVLHRAHNGPEYEGDWAWTPPSGARQPGETIEECVARELFEEAGLRVKASPAGTPVTTTGVSHWTVFYVRVRSNERVTLRDEEHDRFEWVSLEEVLTRCRPAQVTEGIEFALRTLGFV